MCGFIGHISTLKNESINLDLPNRRIECRGPDKKQFTSFTANDIRYSLFFNRLRILDLSELADQPMFSKNKKTVLMFNGEIFNHQELRKELITKGLKFLTNKSDTETLLNGLDYYGKQFIKKLRGQFSIVYIDFYNSEIILARDRLGQKPLFYEISEKSLSFSSNLKSLSEIKKDNKVNISEMNKYLEYGVIKSPSTIYKNIFKVSPAEIITIKFQAKKFKLQKEKYWNPEEYIDNIDFDNDEFFDIFSQSINIRKEADVRVANLLSGGLDSTSIIKNLYSHNEEINTFSVTFPKSKYDEKIWSDIVSKKYSTNHTNLEVAPNIGYENVVKTIDSLDEPYCDPSLVPSYIVYEEISKYFKVAISGDGGDELLGGYSRVINSLNQNIKVNNYFSNIYKAFPPALGTGNFFLKRNKNLETRYKSYLSDKKFLNLLNLEVVEIDQYIHINKNIDEYKSLLLNEYQLFLSEMMLLKVDRTSMYHSLEVRSPFLDHILIEYVLSHSTNYIQKDNPKALLKNYLMSDFGIEFTHRTKQGFVFDLEKWIYNHNRIIFEILSESLISTFFEIKNIKYLLIYKSRINAIRIWKLLTLHYFFEDK